MPLPRAVLPNKFYLITRRCTQRQFILRPDRETNNAFIYCLAVAAERCRIEVILPIAMSNHHHTVIYDRHGTYPEFIEHFHKLFARCQNAYRGRWENLWASEQTSVVELVDTAAVLDKLCYAATNPVAADLVAQCHHWPGVNGVRELLHGRVFFARRPRHFFRQQSTLPDDVTLELQIPSELGPAEETRRSLQALVKAAELAHQQRRALKGQQVLGRRGVRCQRWTDSSQSFEVKRRLRPRIACRYKWRRVEALARNKAFLVAYAAARAVMLAGDVVRFPPGTYWLRRFTRVDVVDE